MSNESRHYQVLAKKMIRDCFAQNLRRVILCIPTGGGKTWVFSDISNDCALLGNRVVIFTHRIELQDQAQSYNSGGTVTVVMIETLWNRIKKTSIEEILEGYSLVIIDEAHIGNFKKVMDILPKGMFVIGATATPISKPPMKDYYDALVEPITIQQLIEQGYLATPHHYASSVLVEADFKSLTKSGEDFTTQSNEVLFNTNKVRGGVIKEFIEKEAYKAKSIIFCASIQSSIDLAKDLKEALKDVEHGHCTRVLVVHSKMPKQQRDNIIDQYKHTPHYIVIINCGILTTGFDCPDIEIVAVNRATMSLALWMQMCGRGSRVVKGRKHDFQIWDFGGNIGRLGHWNQRISWKQIFLEPDKVRGKVGMKSTKTCPKCAAFISSSARKCKFCDYIYPPNLVAVLTGKLEPMDYQDIARLDGRRLFSLSTQELAEYIVFKKYKKHFFEMILFHSGRRDVLEQYWDLMGYKYGYRRERKEWLGKVKKLENSIVKI